MRKENIALTSPTVAEVDYTKREIHLSEYGEHCYSLSFQEIENLYHRTKIKIGDWYKVSWSQYGTVCTCKQMRFSGFLNGRLLFRGTHEDLLIIDDKDVKLISITPN